MQVVEKEHGDIVWVWLGYTRPAKAIFLSRVIYAGDDTAVKIIGAGMKIVRTCDVFNNEESALKYSIVRQQKLLSDITSAISIYESLIKEVKGN